MCCYSPMNSLVVFGFLLCISDSESMRTLKNVAVKSGQSVTIPCFYHERYKSNRKFWCRGHYWSSCSIVAYANISGGTSVIDHPSRNMFTVELKNLNTYDSGYYWCAAEIGDKYEHDDCDYLYLTVSEVPAVSVNKSRVSGEEGSSVSVQCLYSAAYQNKQKRWCRYTHMKCFTAGRTNTSQNSSVQISDDWKRSFMVVMMGLKKSDAGWYWCSIGDLKVSVHLSVTDPLRATATSVAQDKEKTSIRVTTSVTAVSSSEEIIVKSSSTTRTQTNANQINNSQEHKEEELLVVWSLTGLGLLLLVILVCSIIINIKRKCKEVTSVTSTSETNTDPPAETSAGLVIYSSVVSKSAEKKTKQKNLEKRPGVHDDVIYSCVVRPR